MFCRVSTAFRQQQSAKASSFWCSPPLAPARRCRRSVISLITQPALSTRVLRFLPDAGIVQAVDAFKSKLAVEQALKQSGLKYAILRPHAFFENFNMPAFPLKQGRYPFPETET